jgi:hypothetical protein
MSCAGKLKPPRGWSLEDDRWLPPLFIESRPDRGPHVFFGYGV